LFVYLKSIPVKIHSVDSKIFNDFLLNLLSDYLKAVSFQPMASAYLFGYPFLSTRLLRN